MLREFCQVTDSRSIFVYQSMQEKLPPTGTATGSSLRTHGDTKKMAAISSLTATILSHFLYFGRIISIFRILHRILPRTIHWNSLHRCSYFDQIAIRIIETDHLLPPAVCHQPVDIPNIRIQLFKLSGKCFDIRFFEI